MGETINAEIIGERLRSLRGDRTQQEIADAVGVTTMAISDYERGNRVPRDKYKLALARFFQTTVEAIFFSPD